MRLAAVGLGLLLLAACASSPTDSSNQPVDRACRVSECFYERDVRDFEVIDNTTLIVYVGSQRCAFQVELDGTFCDMTMAPELYFRTPSRRVDEEATYGSNRICSNDRMGVDGGPFTESLGDRAPDSFGGIESQCRIRNVESLTDDQLVELYVARGVTAPPPPIGSGEIEVDSGNDEEADSGAEPSDEATEEPRDETGAPSDASREAGDAIVPTALERQRDASQPR